MEGRWYIDDVDIFTRYGVGITAEGINDLFLFPALKTPYFNDWPEQDGIDANLNDPKLQNKTVNISFACVKDPDENVENFLAFLNRDGYRSLYIASIDRVWQLRAATEASRRVFRNGQQFTIQFVDDFPRSQFFDTFYVIASEEKEVIRSEDFHFAYKASNEGFFQIKDGHGFPDMPKSLYQMDGVRFDEYGIIVEQAKESIFSMPAIKKNLERNLSNQDGVIYDMGMVRFASKDVTLKCCFYCDNLLRFWSNYMAFFTDLVKPKERSLWVSYTEESFPFFYKQTSNFKFSKTRQSISLRFDLVLTFTRFRPKKIVKVLGTENDRKIIIENMESLIVV